MTIKVSRPTPRAAEIARILDEQLGISDFDGAQLKAVCERYFMFDARVDFEFGVQIYAELRRADLGAAAAGIKARDRQ